MDVQFTTIPFGSAAYDELVRLRISALLAPIGIPPSYIDPQKERGDIFIGAFDSTALVGCCVLTERSRERVQLRQMAVLPALQGRRIGAAIIAFAEKTARERGYRTLMMHARNPVIGFYEKCGYALEGDEFFEVGMGHRRMVKTL